MNGVGESSVVLVPSVHNPFGATKLSPLKGFSTSPPERIGIRGEYDYNGLANRVLRCFNQSVKEDISQLKVRQRGCVVILTGVVSSRTLLDQLVALAANVEGTAHVEIRCVRFTEEAAIT
ncbi:hypothetical protein S7335_3254 [Synechococcus sp. PCC 7335]|uniref:hypothetical protein n=1 Tax=Synechococcus sp. (strain ATCC 29403 / PCC 7335) TaxID=91464 RepID=UPI00017ED26C|nr:hypothetical protein [Synechococcus sp. PCC 7335]EDX85553.1 hypothetical protein S7335_3254 [Synechococcus sp. PCC 7335]